MGPSAPPRCATAPNALALAERGHCATCSPQVWTPYVKTKGMGPASNLGISTDGTFESMTLKHTKNVNASTENNNSNRKRATFCKKGLARQELEPWNGTYSFTTLIVIPVSQLYILFFFSTVQAFSPSGLPWARLPRESLYVNSRGWCGHRPRHFISQETAYPSAKDSIHKITHCAKSVQELKKKKRCEQYQHSCEYRCTASTAVAAMITGNNTSQCLKKNVTLLRQRY